jgi:hypothetical protein
MEIEQLIEILKHPALNPEFIGYIVLPSSEGFNIHEIDEDNLKCYLKYDNLRNYIHSIY